MRMLRTPLGSLAAGAGTDGLEVTEDIKSNSIQSPLTLAIE